MSAAFKFESVIWMSRGLEQCKYLREKPDYFVLLWKRRGCDRVTDKKNPQIGSHNRTCIMPSDALTGKSPVENWYKKRVVTTKWPVPATAPPGEPHSIAWEKERGSTVFRML